MLLKNKKRIFLLYCLSILITHLFTNKELNEISKNTEIIIGKENTEYANLNREKEPEIIRVDAKNNASDEQNKRIEEYLKLLETLGKTQTEYIEMREKLLKVKEKLNVSPDEDIFYTDTISIGDAVIPMDDWVPVYAQAKEMNEGENAKKSFYGTGEIRYVESIVMTRNDMVIEVDNMGDYESFKREGFHVTGYRLVNQYSLNEDGILNQEGYYEDGTIRLVFNRKAKVRVPDTETMPC